MAEQLYQQRKISKVVFRAPDKPNNFIHKHKYKFLLYLCYMSKDLRTIINEEIQEVVNPNWMISSIPDGYEHGILDEQQQILGLPELAELISRMGMDYDILLQVLQGQFQEKGDAGVMAYFKQATELDLEMVRHGKYMLKYN